ncbi:13056_t:CDS:2 [Entrophospora sp. SA101]|nr:13056_t:CDS:2 [Entrophospora sp. SA101]
MRAVGIDFGNNNSRVGVWQRNHIEIIPNELGSRITPSCVAFTETERSIGSEAKNKMATNPHNTLYNVRRLIARRYDDNEVQLNIKVTVKDCTSGKWEQLTITNDDGRLSNDELARMIADSERYCADDERIIQRMEAHNKLEERFNNTIQETITWFDDNQEAGKHEYDYKREILEKIFYPVTSICEKGFFD